MGEAKLELEPNLVMQRPVNNDYVDVTTVHTYVAIYITTVTVEYPILHFRLAENDQSVGK